MADNVAITAGTGTAIATDEIQVSGTNAIGHVQFVKLVDGTLNGTGAIGGDAANGLDVDVTRLPALAAGTNNIGDVDVLSVPAPLSTTGTGTEATALRVTIATDSTGVLSVDDNGGAITVDNGGTFAVQIDAGAVTSLALIDDPVFADDAAFTIGTSKVNVAGAVAVAHGSNPDAADALDAVAMITNRHRVPFVIGGHPNVLTLRATYTSAQTDVALVTVSAGTKIVVTQAQVAVSNATTATPSVIIGFGTANTPTTTGVVLAHPGIPGGGGISRGDGSGILGVGADDADLRITISVPTGGTLDTVISYYTIES